MSEPVPPLSSQTPASGLHLLYSTALYVAGGVALPAAALGMLTRPRWRFGVSQRLGRPDERVEALADRRPLWLHAASMGEVRAAWPLLRALKLAHPDVPLVVSTTTPEGYRTAEQLELADAVTLLPLDFPGAVRRALARVRPRGVVILETELWPNFLRAARRQGVAAIIVNGRISDRSYPRYQRWRPLIRRVLADVRFAGMQTERDMERIVELGADPGRAGVLGNLKYDVLRLDPPAPAEALRVAVGADPVWVAGSTHRGEEEMVLDAFAAIREHVPDMRLILAPRHVDRRSEVEELLRSRDLEWVRRSELPGPAPIILLDTTGELAGAFGLAHVGFIGGSLIPRGGHNPLEAVAHGVPVLMGPHTHNFREVTGVVTDSGAARVVETTSGLVHGVRAALDDDAFRQAAVAATETIATEHGAIDAALQTLAPVLEAAP